MDRLWQSLPQQDLYNESLEISKRLGNQGGIAISLHQLATLAEDKDTTQKQPNFSLRPW